MNKEKPPDQPGFESEGEWKGVSEEEILEKAREDIKAFKEKEDSGEVQSAHLKGTENFPPVDIDALSGEDLRIWNRREEISREEFQTYRGSIDPKDYDRYQFAAFIGNMIQPRIMREEIEQKKNNF